MTGLVTWRYSITNCLLMKKYVPSRHTPPATPLNSLSCTVRTKTSVDHASAIVLKTQFAQLWATEARVSNAEVLCYLARFRQLRRLSRGKKENQNEQIRKVSSSRDRFRDPCDFCRHSRRRDQGSRRGWRMQRCQPQREVCLQQERSEQCRRWPDR